MLGLVRGAILGQVQERVASVTANVTQKSLDWQELNFPLKQVGILHFDLAELKEKRSVEVYTLVLNFARWMCLVFGIMGWNLITTIILTSVVPGYSGLSIVLCFVEAIIGGGTGMATVWFVYHGWADSVGRSKTIGRVGSILMLVFCLVLALVFGGNVNGLAGLGGGVASS